MAQIMDELVFRSGVKKTQAIGVLEQLARLGSGNLLRIKSRWDIYEEFVSVNHSIRGLHGEFIVYPGLKKRL